MSDSAQNQPQTSQVLPQTPQAIMQDDSLANAVLQSTATTDPLNPLGAVSGKTAGAKERTAAGSLDALAKEVPGAQAVESEKSAELPPELETWMEKVESHEMTAPKQVVVADKTATMPTGNYAAQPVIVLPLTQSGIQTGVTKSVTDSVRWLAEWCLRVMKKFKGMVVYRRIA